MIPLRLDEIAGLVDGRLDGADPAALVTGSASIDSRAVEPGGLFVAFAGENVDGHDYAAAAVEAGAAAVLATRSTGVPSILVDDAEAALQALAREVLVRLRADGDLQVLALTGSQGKTSTKDLLARVLADAGPTVATLGSFNNELGMPLTVLRAERSTRFLVLEMGARGIGHLARLCRIAPPDVSVVLNVGRAHLGEFGSQDNIAIAKGELVEALGADGTAVLNADDVRVAAMRSRTRGRVVTFGRDAGAEIRLGDVELDDLGRASFTLQHGEVTVPVRLRLLGAHQVSNAAAAAAAATAVGVGLDRAAASLSAVESLSRWRMELHERADGLVVINDAYNANPDSMRAALDTLAQMGARTGRRTVAVLGEMRELGEESEAEHAAIGRALDELGIAVSVVIGPRARAIAGDTTRYVESVDEAVTWLRHNGLRDDLVLVKASRGARLERVAEALLDDETDETDGRTEEEVRR